MRTTIAGMDVEVVRKRNKNMYLRLRPGGELLVTAPVRTSDAEVERFVTSHLAWIERHRGDAERVVAPQLRSCVSGEELWVWGERHELLVLRGNRYDLSVFSGLERAVLTVPGNSNPESRRAWLRTWYRNLLVPQAEREVARWEEATGLKACEVRPKWMTSRWGTCNTRDKRIWLNVQLAKHPRESLEYVALHEVAHLAVPNHGPQFQAILDRHMPDWRERRRELNRREFSLTEK